MKDLAGIDDKVERQTKTVSDLGKKVNTQTTVIDLTTKNVSASES